MESCWELAAYTKADWHRRDHHLDLPALSFSGFAQALIIIRHVLSFFEIRITESLTFKYIAYNTRASKCTVDAVYGIVFLSKWGLIINKLKFD